MNNIKLKKLLPILFSVVLGVTTISLTGCGTKDSDNGVRIGYFNNITHPQALLMKADGSLQDAMGDVTVTWTAFNAGPAETEALFASEIDIGYIGPVPAVSANVKSMGDVQILSSSSQAGAVLVKRAGADIYDITDLAGKTVAIPQLGNTQHLCLLSLMAENGLDTVENGGTVTVAAISNADVANAMDRGDIDAALVPEPWGSTLLSKGAELVLDETQIFESGKYDVAVVVVRKDFYAAHPDIVEKFLKAHENATMELNENKEHSIAVINELLSQDTGKNLAPEILEEAFSRIGISTNVNKDALRKFAEISQSQGFIKELPDDKLYVK